MKFHRILDDPITCARALFVVLAGFPALAISAEPLPAQAPGPVAKTAPKADWIPPQPVKSGKSLPPRIPEVVAKADHEFKAEMASDPAALRNSRVLRTPLVGSPQRGSAAKNGVDRADLGNALAAYQKAGGGEFVEGRRALEAFLERHGEGDYGPALRLELADAYWRTGAWEKALEQWEKAWARASQSDENDVEARRLGDVILSKLLTHTALLGRKERLRAILDGIAGRKSGGDANNAIRRGRELLWFLDNRAEQNVFCGFSAANLVCVPLGQNAIYPDVHDEEEKKSFIASGVSLWDIAEHSKEGGGDLRCVQKIDSKAPFAVPSVIHWNFGHFSALVETSEDGKVRLEDAQLKFNSWVNPEVIAEAGSGYALLPGGGELPAGYREVPEAEARNVFGRHCCHGHDDEGCDCETGCSGSASEPSKAMATYSLNLRRASHILTDTPVSYATPGGSEVLFTLKYLAIPPASTPTSISNTFGFGPLWFPAFGGGSVELKGTGAPNTSVQWNMGIGNYNTYTYSAGAYTKKQAELPMMTYLASGAGGPGYRLTFPDGSLQDYTFAVNSPATRYLLKRSVTPQGLERIWGYDGQARLVSLTDEWGKISEISYAPEEGDATGYSDRIRRITDPHGRYATFIYDTTGRLKKITDPIGIVSEFTYDSEDVITTLTTPYGDTSFELTTERIGGSLIGSSVIATDPRGFKEKVVQTDAEPVQVLNAGGTPVGSAPAGAFKARDWNSDGEYGDRTAQAPSTVNGVSFIPKNNNLHWRNSFYWDKKAMFHSPDDWNAATVYNWKANTASYIVPALSSMRAPGQGRVWFNYPGQSSADGAISSYQPAKTVRQVEVGGSPVWTMTQQTYNSLGLPLLFTDEKGRQTKINYAANNQDISSIEVLSDYIEYWGPGGFTREPVFSPVRSYTYSGSNHLPATLTEPSGLVSTFIYNAKGQTTEIQKSNGSNVEKIRYTYAASGSGTIPAWPGSPGFLRKVERTDPVNSAGWVTTDLFSYDSVGRVESHTAADGYQRTMDYDDFDRLTLVTHPDATTEQLVYDRLDLTDKKDRAGRWTHTEYNSVRQPETQVAADGKTTQLDWCLCGQLQELIDPMGNSTKWTWEPGGYLKEKIMPDLSKTTYAYEANSGRLWKVTSPNQQGTGSPTVTYSYSQDGSLQSENYTDPDTPDVTYLYEPENLGRLKKVTDGIGIHEFDYAEWDPVSGGGVLRIIDGPLANDVIRNTPDWQGRVGTVEILQDTVFTNLRSESYTWDSLGRMKTVANTLGTHTFGYQSNLSRVDGLTGPNGVTANIVYEPTNAPGDSARSLKSITHSRGSSQQAKHIYSHDRAGRITGWEQQSIGQPTMKTGYAYNSGDELVEANDTNLATNTLVDREVWGFDQGGNWLSRTRSSDGVMETRTVNEMNRLTRIGGAGSTVVEGLVNEFARVSVNAQQAELSSDPVNGGYRFKGMVEVKVGANSVNISATDPQAETTSQTWRFNVPGVSRSFSYDANGNTLSDGIRTFTWDAKNRLRTVKKDGVTWKWDYDYRDRRVKEYENGVLTKIFIWNDDEIVQERNASNGITRTHFFGGFSDGATATSGTKYQTLEDHLGNVREVLTTTGTVAARYDYTPYQGPVKIGTSTVEATFQTIGSYYHHAGSGLELALYRAYDPNLGRWLSPDPLGEEGGINLYGYVENNPVNNLDPLGLDPYSQAYLFGLRHQGVSEEVRAMATQQEAKGAIIGGGILACGVAAATVPTATVAVGAGGRVLPSGPGFHVVFGAGGKWLHGLGNGGVITSIRAAKHAANAWFRITIPVLSREAVTSTSGTAKTCVHAAARGIGRGWGVPIANGFKAVGRYFNSWFQ